MAVSRTAKLESIFLLAFISGHLVAAEGAYKPSEPVNVRVWTNSSSSPPFVYPELSDGDFGMPQLQKKPNLGICVSGGAFLDGLNYSSRQLNHVTVACGSTGEHSSAHSELSCTRHCAAYKQHDLTSFSMCICAVWLLPLCAGGMRATTLALGWVRALWQVSDMLHDTFDMLPAAQFD
jgi:hypothetical protein